MHLRSGLAVLILIPWLIDPGAPLAQPAQVEPETATVVGRLISGRSPVEFANVIVAGTRRGAQTDETGKFTITRVPFGTFTLIATSIGFERLAREIVVQDTLVDLGTLKMTPKLDPHRWDYLGNECVQMSLPPKSGSPEFQRLRRFDTSGWQWVGGSIFDFPLPMTFHVPAKRGIGIDSEVGRWEDRDRTVSFDLGQYTGHRESGPGVTSQVECCGGMNSVLSLYETDFEPGRAPRYVLEAFFPNVGLGIYGECVHPDDRAVFLTAFRAIRFHPPSKGH